MGEGKNSGRAADSPTHTFTGEGLDVAHRVTDKQYPPPRHAAAATSQMVDSLPVGPGEGIPMRTALTQNIGNGTGGPFAANEWRCQGRGHDPAAITKGRDTDIAVSTTPHSDLIGQGVGRYFVHHGPEPKRALMIDVPSKPGAIGKRCARQSIGDHDHVRREGDFFALALKHDPIVGAHPSLGCPEKDAAKIDDAACECFVQPTSFNGDVPLDRQPGARATGAHPEEVDGQRPGSG